MWQILRQGLIRNWIGVLLCLVLGGALFGSGFWLGQRSGRSQMKGLATQGVHSPYSPGNRLAGANGAYSMLPPGSNLPANATPEMKEFMENRAALMQKMAALRQANPNGGPEVMQQFREQNKDLLAKQQQLAQAIGQEQAKNPLPEPPPLQIPPNASPQMQTYLKARDQLMRDQVAFMNQHRTDEPAARQAAMQQWRQQNAARFQQIQQQAQGLASTQSSHPTITTTPATTPNK